MEVDQIELKIFLESCKRPIIAIISEKSQVDRFFSLLNNDLMFVKFGDIIFAKRDFLRAEIKL